MASKQTGSFPQFHKKPDVNPLLHLTTWHFSDANTGDGCYSQTERCAGLSSEQRVGEASPDTLMFKPVAARLLFASGSLHQSNHLIATSRIMEAPAI